VKYDLESWYDYLYIIDNATGNYSRWSGNSSDYVWVEQPGATSIFFRFTSDNSVNGWGVDVDYIDCYSPGANTTTTSTTTASTTTSTNNTSTTTISGICSMPGNVPPCSLITLAEVVSGINEWADGRMSLVEVIALINSWADPAANPPR
jgi:hypothetical protein